METLGGFNCSSDDNCKIWTLPPPTHIYELESDQYQNYREEKFPWVWFVDFKASAYTAIQQQKATILLIWAISCSLGLAKQKVRGIILEGRELHKVKSLNIYIQNLLKLRMTIKLYTWPGKTWSGLEIYSSWELNKLSGEIICYLPQGRQSSEFESSQSN